MVTSIMKKRIIRERKKNRRQTIAVWITNRQINDLMERSLYRFYECFPLLRPARRD